MTECLKRCKCGTTVIDITVEDILPIPPYSLSANHYSSKRVFCNNCGLMVDYSLDFHRGRWKLFKEKGQKVPY